LIRHFFRSFYQGDFDLIDAEVPHGRLVLELTFPKEFKPGGASAPLNSLSQPLAFLQNERAPQRILLRSLYRADPTL